MRIQYFLHQFALTVVTFFFVFNRLANKNRPINREKSHWLSSNNTICAIHFLYTEFQYR